MKHDLYLVIPVIRIEKRQNNVLPSEQFNEAKEHYEYIANLVLYEEYAEKIHREYVGNPNVRFCGEDTFSSLAIMTKWHSSEDDCFQVESGYCTLTIIIKDMFVNILKILNAVPKGEIFISTSQDNNFVEVKDWLGQLGLAQAAPIKSIVFASQHLEKEYINYVLATETGDPELEPLKPLSSIYINQCSTNNIAQYSSASVYASDNVVLEIPSPFKDEFKDRLKGELATLFVVELHVQGLAFLSHLDRHLNDAGKNPERVDSDTLTTISTDLFNAARLWDSDIYRYVLAKSFSDAMGKSFKINESLQKLSSSKKMFDQLINIIKLSRDEKESKQSEEDNKKITMLLNAVAMLQAIQFLYQVFIYMFSLNTDTNMEKPNIWGVVIGAASFIALILVIKIFFKKQKMLSGLWAVINK